MVVSRCWAFEESLYYLFYFCIYLTFAAKKNEKKKKKSSVKRSKQVYSFPYYPRDLPLDILYELSPMKGVAYNHFQLSKADRHPEVIPTRSLNLRSLPHILRD